MRVANWNPDVGKDEIGNAAGERMKKAGEVLAKYVRRNCPVGTISRPMYVRGPYKGQPWTARDSGQLKRSTRVVTKRGKTGKELLKSGNVRVYAGNDLAFYASIVEAMVKPFMRTAVTDAHSEMKSVIENG